MASRRRERSSTLCAFFFFSLQTCIISRSPIMINLDEIFQCSRNATNISDLCTNDSINAAGNCQSMPFFIFLLQADCYTKPIFFSLSALLTVIGTVLNLCSSFCFWKIIKRRPQYIYLLALSIGDTINLQVNFTLPLLRKSNYIDVSFRGFNRLCRLTGVVTEFFLIFPTWIVVLLALEGWIFLRQQPRCSSAQNRRRVKAFIASLVIGVLLLSIYRWWDSKGIDQLSVFAVFACNDEHEGRFYFSHINLILWSVLPECCTLILILIIVNRVKLTRDRMKPEARVIRRKEYNQVNRIALFVSILFIICHTPTGKDESSDEALSVNFSIDRSLR